jgi:pimeloyl-ACP methyl ester carboxylesterase
MENKELKIDESEWKGFKRLDFELSGRNCVVVKPRRPQKAGKWIWRTEFFGAFDYADIAMLKLGYYLIYYRLSDMYGNEESVELMKNAYDALLEIFRFRKKVILFGFSRGGLYAVNFAVKYPETIAALYLDAPVLDINDWPRQKNRECWRECLNCYGIDEKDIEIFTGTPIHKMGVLIKNKIPLIIVAGDKDEVVDYEKNAKLLAEQYFKSGVKFQLILKNGAGHHPHSLESPDMITAFLIGAG